MARLPKLRKALTGTCLALLLGCLVAACEVSPAASLGLPPITVEVPRVSVKAPAVTVTTPSVSIKTPAATTPTVPVITPTVPVKAPTVPVKAPAPVKAPTVSTKIPTVPAATTPAKAPSVKAPSVKVGTPSVSGQPSVAAPTPSAPSIDRAAAPAGRATLTTATPAGGKSAGTGSTPSHSVAPNSASNVEPGGQGSPGYGSSGYAGGPSAGSQAGERGTRRSSGERARIAEDRSLAATVTRLQGCLSELPESHRRALMLRTGVGSPQALSPRAAAARLHLGAARFARVERQALGELREAARTDACGRMSEIVAALVAFVGPSAGGGRSAGAGGVEAARYAFSPPSQHAIKPAAAPSSGSLLGNISPTASSAIFILLLVVAAAIAAGVVVIHGSGNSPWGRWRRRVADGLRRAR
jgi:outer membrane biosynthesis protein TonB